MRPLRLVRSSSTVPQDLAQPLISLAPLDFLRRTLQLHRSCTDIKVDRGVEIASQSAETGVLYTNSKVDYGARGFMSSRNQLKYICFFIFSSLVITGCFGNSSTPFIVEGDILEPLRESRASWPDNDRGWAFKRGSNDDSPGWCDANGFIEASVEQVWEALRDADVVVERARVDTWREVGSCEAEPFERMLRVLYAHERDGR